MIKRSIAIFPVFENDQYIHQLREKYDPIHHLIPPHITLVFPFESNITAEELQGHVRNVLADEKPFSIKLQGITGEGGRYLFLNVKEGNDDLIRLHDKLYSGKLKRYLYRKVSYLPHLTVGRLEGESALEKALDDTEDCDEVFSTVVREVVVEKIDEDERSHIEMKCQLKN